MTAAPRTLVTGATGVVGAQPCAVLEAKGLPRLGWAPPMSVDEALARTVAWYFAEGSVRAH